tara:strand:- start:3907 stop:4419 length:513 start_codon:yes stop_codon:yes gene_type:complete
MEDILKKADNYPGKIVIVGFGNGTYPNFILDLMRQDKIKKRDFIVLDSLDKRPPQPAYDFKHSVPNSIKKKVELIENTLGEVDSKVGIFFIDERDATKIKAILKHYSKFFEDPCQVVIRNYSSNQLADTILSWTTSKNTTTVVRTENFSYFSIKSNLLNNNPSRTKSVLS